MFSRSFVAAAAALCVVAVSGAAQADRRQYLVTYGYYTPQKGEIEVEQWTESFVPKDGGSSYRSRTEFEYGVTDRLAASLYFVNKKPAGESFGYDETKLELRYRLNEPGNKFWDTAGYAELARPSDSEEPYEVEVKGIFSHEFPKFNLTLNIIGEKELKAGEKVELGYAAGIAPDMSGRIRYSLEAFGGEDEHYIMPALWISPGKRQNLGIGVAKGLTSGSDNIQVRTLYAVEF